MNEKYKDESVTLSVKIDLTVLDYFAAQALVALMTVEGCVWDRLGRDAYDVAEQMVSEKRRREGESK